MWDQSDLWWWGFMEEGWDGPAGGRLGCADAKANTHDPLPEYAAGESMSAFVPLTRPANWVRERCQAINACPHVIPLAAQLNWVVNIAGHEGGCQAINACP